MGDVATSEIQQNGGPIRLPATAMNGCVTARKPKRFEKSIISDDAIILRRVQALLQDVSSKVRVLTRERARNTRRPAIRDMFESDGSGHCAFEL